MRSGRRLGCAEHGDPNGYPVLLFHGLPGSRRFRHPDETVAERLGARVIAVDRPGYGLSDFQPGRRMLDWPDDILQLAEALNFNRFAVCGVSGGGAYAMACGARIPERITKIALVSSVAPFDAADAVAGFNERTRRLIRLVQFVPWQLLIPYLAGQPKQMRQDPDGFFERVLAGFSESDREVVREPSVKAVMTEEWEAAFAAGVRGYAADLAVILRPWGFSPAQVSPPVDHWHGDADRMVPGSMARYLNHKLPNLQGTVWCKGEGHSLIFPHWEEILGHLQ